MPGWSAGSLEQQWGASHLDRHALCTVGNIFQGLYDLHDLLAALPVPEGDRKRGRDGGREEGGGRERGRDGGRDEGGREVEANPTYQAQRVVQTCDIGVTTSASSPLFELYTFCFTKPGSTT